MGVRVRVFVNVCRLGARMPNAGQLEVDLEKPTAEICQLLARSSVACWSRDSTKRPPPVRTCTTRTNTLLARAGCFGDCGKLCECAHARVKRAMPHIHTHATDKSAVMLSLAYTGA